jgi:tight adherence protein C
MSELVSLALALGGDGLVMALVTVSLVIAVLAGHAAMAPKGNLRTRLASLAQRRPTLDNRALRGTRADFTAGRLFDTLKLIVEHFRLTRGEEAQQAAVLLAQAGWRTREALVIYFGLRLVLPLGLTILVILVQMSVGITGMPQLASGVIAAAAGFYLPQMMLRRMVKARHIRFHRALPDALDLLVICAEAGLGLDGALNRVAREFRRFQPEVAEELALTGLELGFLPSRRDALMNMAKRVNIPSVNSLVHTLNQTERYGTPLSQALKTIAADLREERMLVAEEKAARLPATMTVPMILFILPAVFIVLIGPAIIQIVQNFGGD